MKSKRTEARNLINEVLGANTARILDLYEAAAGHAESGEDVLAVMAMLEASKLSCRALSAVGLTDADPFIKAKKQLKQTATVATWRVKHHSKRNSVTVSVLS